MINGGWMAVLYEGTFSARATAGVYEHISYIRKHLIFRGSWLDCSTRIEALYLILKRSVVLPTNSATPVNDSKAYCGGTQ